VIDVGKSVKKNLFGCQYMLIGAWVMIYAKLVLNNLRFLWRINKMTTTPYNKTLSGELSVFYLTEVKNFTPIIEVNKK